jgi:hypothetical protein
VGLTPADRLALGAVEASLAQARDGLDPRPALEVLAGSLAELGLRSAPSGTRRLVSRDLRAWLRRLESTGRRLATHAQKPCGGCACRSVRAVPQDAGLFDALLFDIAARVATLRA